MGALKSAVNGDQQGLVLVAAESGNTGASLLGAGDGVSFWELGVPKVVAAGEVVLSVLICALWKVRWEHMENLFVLWPREELQSFDHLGDPPLEFLKEVNVIPMLENPRAGCSTAGLKEFLSVSCIILGSNKFNLKKKEKGNDQKGKDILLAGPKKVPEIISAQVISKSWGKLTSSPKRHRVSKGKYVKGGFAPDLAIIIIPMAL
ncbi:hypothetical protein DUI87_16204 [Hirundo rustica rustica]|uniref:Uncharacterized protein n=1 Tax=Hirundo rustica rustica TaxID=333673 RepID=A0A3M0K196_HIRRU|nr:hypothetical protein DUI87_16204 [Hirundo rustica rustica]